MHTGQWLTIRYVPVLGADAAALGILLYIPEFDKLYFRFREDTAFILAADLEVIADFGNMLQTLSGEYGAKHTFDWAASSLSNTVRAEGPFVVAAISDPVQTIAELYQREIDS